MSPRPPTPSPCRSCKAPVLWATTDAGKLMPVDAAPRDDGALTLLVREGVLVVTAWKEVLHPATKGWKRYTAHFVTCPQGKRWSRKGQEEPKPNSPEDLGWPPPEAL